MNPVAQNCLFDKVVAFACSKSFARCGDAELVDTVVLGEQQEEDQVVDQVSVCGIADHQSNVGHQVEFGEITSRLGNVFVVHL